MNLGQYQRCSQAPEHPMAVRYDGSQAMSSQPNDQTHSLDSLPRFPTGNEFFNAWPSTINNYNPADSMLAAQPQTEWVNPAYTPPTFDDANLVRNCDYYYQSSTTIQRLPQNEGFSLGQTCDGIPCTWQLAHETAVPAESTALVPNVYDPSPYPRDQRSDETAGFPSLYDAPDRSGGFSQLSERRSPNLETDMRGNTHPRLENAPRPMLQLSEGSDDSGTSSREMTAVEFDDSGIEEPYAKLIHRALMSAPNHSMVLQEIYQWFRDNTAKGSSDTKGWMNSIRHNLSMNAAFRKSERKINDDENKKSTEWVLEDFAIRDGVQSTTRYRKGTGNKKGARSDNPTPARQTSGRKGGLCASKSKLQRQKIKDDREDRRSTTRAEASRQLRLQRNSRVVAQRQMTPLTPPNLENVASPYFFPKNEPLDLPYEDIYGLEDVQGVYVDDHGPLFCNGQLSPFMGKHGLAAHLQ